MLSGESCMGPLQGTQGVKLEQMAQVMSDGVETLSS